MQIVSTPDAFVLELNVLPVTGLLNDRLVDLMYPPEVGVVLVQ